MYGDLHLRRLDRSRGGLGKLCEKVGELFAETEKLRAERNFARGAGLRRARVEGMIALSSPKRPPSSVSAAAGDFDRGFRVIVR